MTLVLADRVKETTTSTGTTAITLAGAATGYQTFSSAVGNANTTYYTIADQTGTNWEVGIGTYTSSGNTLSRDTVLASSNGGSLVAFTAGTKDVFVTYPAERALYTGGPLGTPSSGTLTNATGYTYANLSGTVPTWNQSTTGNALTATTATTATNLASGSAGTIPYQTASGTTAMLAVGTLGQVLTSAGAAAPTWSTPAAATKTISNKTGAYTVVAGDLGKIINCTSGTFTVSLTAAATLGSGFTCTIWNTSTTSSNVITIDPNASETIDGVATLTLQRGEGLAIVCDGTNWQTDDKKPMRGYAENLANSSIRPIAGNGSIAIGVSADASYDGSVAIGLAATTNSGSSYRALAIGLSCAANGNYSTAIGANSSAQGSQAVTGAGAMALGGSYASGTDSFAAAIGNNTSSYGAQQAKSIAIGYQAKVSVGVQGIAMGVNSIASNNDSVAIGNGANASGDSAFAIGKAATASGVSSWATQYGTASGLASVTFGGLSAQIGKYSFANGYNFSNGTVQAGKIVLYAATTTTTAVALTSDGSAASTTNQLILASGQAMAIQGTLIAKQNGSGNMAGWNITGIVSNNAGTMAVSGLALTLIGVDTIVLGVNLPTIAVDNTNKGVTITSGYKSATSIRWVATVNTSEVVY